MPKHNDKAISLEIDGIKITIAPIGDAVIEKKEDALAFGEEIYQIREGFYYEYKIDKNGYYLELKNVVFNSKINISSGEIRPNLFVGTLIIPIINEEANICGNLKLEVQSSKITYREDYKNMIEDIACRCVDLLMDYNTPVLQHFETDFNVDARTLYQRFAFVKSIVDSNEFNDAVNKVLISPVKKWENTIDVIETTRAKRIDCSIIKQICNSTKRISVLNYHSIIVGMVSIPQKIEVKEKEESVDTQENRFVKYVLKTILSLCNEINSRLDEVERDNRFKKEVEQLINTIEDKLNHSLFKEITNLKLLPLNSPILQRKEGYREILKVWLMIDLAAKLSWKGGEDVYEGNKKDISKLYEYWAFFMLLEVIGDVFGIKPTPDALFEANRNGLLLKLKQGTTLAINGVYNDNNRELEIEFSYNKRFTGEHYYGNAGSNLSWTVGFRPDYTLSIWPKGITKDEAEKQELMVHIHFDAKYKLENINFNSEDDDDKENDIENHYKRYDLLKMHTYKDAIRRTAGAYILYPGNTKYERHEYTEILPGLGAFDIRPIQNKTTNGISELKKFLIDIRAHFMEKSSQREKMALRIYELYNTENSANRPAIPEEEIVLVAYYKDQCVWEWIEENGMYNLRVQSAKISKEHLNLKYLLLHTKQEKTTSKFMRVKNSSTKIFTKNDLIQTGYPLIPRHELYLMYEIERSEEYRDCSWDLNALGEGSRKGYTSAHPFFLTMKDLLPSRVFTQST